MNGKKRYRTYRVTQKTLDARELAKRLMREYGLLDWFFAFCGSKKSLGLCFFDRKVISLSVYFTEINPLSVIEDTVRHEIAHALVGPGHGHDAVWKAKAMEIGANPSRCCSDCIAPPGKWQAVCPSCSKVYHRHRRPKRMTGWYCPKCGQVRGHLTWKEKVTSDNVF